ncbi:hypothetical protein N7535_005910 [Penicillium sp. DV-2018c]|nr:hypothetical protein N7461_009489 [Penicillium sp. DV-2018c]KAJ5572250.1 hypothetical protein N7535_005910 [Penicillium sp. DV-2018c]
MADDFQIVIDDLTNQGIELGGAGGWAKVFKLRPGDTGDPGVALLEASDTRRVTVILPGGTQSIWDVFGRFGGAAPGEVLLNCRKISVERLGREGSETFITVVLLSCGHATTNIGFRASDTGLLVEGTPHRASAGIEKEANVKHTCFAGQAIPGATINEIACQIDIRVTKLAGNHRRSWWDKEGSNLGCERASWLGEDLESQD